MTHIYVSCQVATSRGCCDHHGSKGGRQVGRTGTDGPLKQTLDFPPADVAHHLVSCDHAANDGRRTRSVGLRPSAFT